MLKYLLLPKPSPELYAKLRPRLGKNDDYESKNGCCIHVHIIYQLLRMQGIIVALHNCNMDISIKHNSVLIVEAFQSHKSFNNFEGFIQYSNKHPLSN